MNARPTLEPIIYFLSNSLAIIAAAAFVFFCLGIWFGWLTWARHKRRARAFQEETNMLRLEIARLKRRIVEENTAPALTPAEAMQAAAGLPVETPAEEAASPETAPAVEPAAKSLPEPAPDAAPPVAVEVAAPVEAVAATPAPALEPVVPAAEPVPAPEPAAAMPAAVAPEVAPVEVSAPAPVEPLSAIGLAAALQASAKPATSESPPTPDPAPVPVTEPAPSTTPAIEPRKESLADAVLRHPRVTVPLAAPVAAIETIPAAAEAASPAAAEPVPTTGLSPVLAAAFASELASGSAQPDTEIGMRYVNRPDRWDDLTLLRGVAETLQTRLHEAGIYTFKQIALWTEDHVRHVSHRIGARDRIQRERWVQQARDLHYMKYGEKVEG